MTRQQQRRADVSNGAAYVASSAGILAASIIGVAFLALIIGVATEGIGYALAAVATVAYLQHHDKQQQRTRAQARNSAQQQHNEAQQDTDARQSYAANARARREQGF